MKKSIYIIATALAIIALSACTPAPVDENSAFLTEDQVARLVADDGGTIFTINDFIGDGIYNQSVLNALPAIEETDHVRHVRFSAPVVIKIDGMKKEGVVLLPE